MKLYAIYTPHNETVMREVPFVASSCGAGQIGLRKPSLVTSQGLLWHLPHLEGVLVLSDSHQDAKTTYQTFRSCQGRPCGKVTRLRPKVLEGLPLLKCPYCGTQSTKECFA